jgi:hypothetical protein
LAALVNDRLPGARALRGYLAGLVSCPETTAYAQGSSLKAKAMTLCPIALVTGCQKCPAFKVCPLKSVIGDAPKAGSGLAPPPKKK